VAGHLKAIKGKRSEKARRSCADEFHDDELTYVLDQLLFDQKVRSKTDFKDFKYEDYEALLNQYSPEEGSNDDELNRIALNNPQVLNLEAPKASNADIQKQAHRDAHPNCPCFSHARPNCSEGGKMAGEQTCINICSTCLKNITGSDGDNCFACKVKIDNGQKQVSNRAKPCTYHKSFFGSGGGGDANQGKCIRCHQSPSGTAKKIHFCNDCKLILSCGNSCVYTLCEK